MTKGANCAFERPGVCRRGEHLFLCPPRAAGSGNGLLPHLGDFNGGCRSPGPQAGHQAPRQATSPRSRPTMRSARLPASDPAFYRQWPLRNALQATRRVPSTPRVLLAQVLFGRAARTVPQGRAEMAQESLKRSEGAKVVAALDALLADSGPSESAYYLRGLPPERRARIALARVREAGIGGERLLEITSPSRPSCPTRDREPTPSSCRCRSPS